jgi:GT2 family glycosyltransferase
MTAVDGSAGVRVPLPRAGEPVRVTIAVPTFRRNNRLEALLPLLLQQAREVATASGDRWVAEVLVVDNDPQGGAAQVVTPSAGSGVRYVVESTPGIAAVRNRAMDEAADARLLAFIDDDERPAPGWLSHLLSTWARTGATAVAGPVHAEHAGELDRWIRAGGFFDARSLPTGTAIDVAATGNLLVDLAEVRRLGVRFDAALGLRGGEDNLFSSSLARAGGRLVWCEESAAIEHVPAERMTRRWVLIRSWGSGNTAVLTDLRMTIGTAARARVRVAGLAGGLLRIGGGALRGGWGLLVRSDQHQARGVRTLLRGAGMVGGSCGLVFEEYGRSGRRWRLARGERR